MSIINLEKYQLIHYYTVNMVQLLQVIPLTLVYSLTFAQNLVPNPSFEEYKELPCYFKYFNPGNKEYFNAILEHWELPTTGSSDVYSLLVPDSCETHPSQFVRFGTPNPKDGHNMIGIYVGVFNRPQNSPHYREYVQVKLNEKLTPGQRYFTGFYHSLANFVLASNNLGMLFSTEKVALDSNGVLMHKPQVNNKKIEVNRMEWKLFYGGFIAHKEDEYLTIGNFYTDEATSFKEVGPHGENISYYLIDSVFVEPFSDPYIPNIITPNNDGKNDFFFIEGLKISNWQLSVHNRWGGRVYHTNDYRNNWKGEGLSAGVYFYLLRHQEIGVEYKGTLTIIV